MELHDFALNDGAKLSLGRDDRGIHMLLDGQHLAGPFDPNLAKSRVTVPLPDGRGSAGVHVTYDGRFEAFHDGQAVGRFGWKKPIDKRIRRARRLLLALGVLTYGSFLLLERWDRWGILETETLLIQALGILFLAWWAYVKPDLAWISFGLAIILVTVGALTNLITYDAPIRTLFLPIIYVRVLSKGFAATWEARLAHREPYRRPVMD